VHQTQQRHFRIPMQPTPFTARPTFSGRIFKILSLSTCIIIFDSGIRGLDSYKTNGGKQQKVHHSQPIIPPRHVKSSKALHCSTWKAKVVLAVLLCTVTCFLRWWIHTPPLSRLLMWIWDTTCHVEREPQHLASVLWNRDHGCLWTICKAGTYPTLLACAWNEARLSIRYSILWSLRELCLSKKEEHATWEYCGSIPKFYHIIFLSAQHPTCIHTQLSGSPLWIQWYIAGLLPRCLTIHKL
jgi:hypothetical protein